MKTINRNTLISALVISGLTILVIALIPSDSGSRIKALSIDSLIYFRNLFNIPVRPMDAPPFVLADPKIWPTRESGVIIIDFPDVTSEIKDSDKDFEGYFNLFENRLSYLAGARSVIICLPGFLSAPAAEPFLFKSPTLAGVFEKNKRIIGTKVFSAVDNSVITEPNEWAKQNLPGPGFHKSFADSDGKTRGYPFLRQGQRLHPSVLTCVLATVFKASLGDMRIGRGWIGFEKDSVINKIPADHKYGLITADYRAKHEIIGPALFENNLVRPERFDHNIVIIGPVEKGKKIRVPGKNNVITETELLALSISNVLKNNFIVFMSREKTLIILFLTGLVLFFLFSFFKGNTISFLIFICLNFLICFFASFPAKTSFSIPLVLLWLVLLFVFSRVYTALGRAYEKKRFKYEHGAAVSPYYMENAINQKNFPFDTDSGKALVAVITWSHPFGSSKTGVVEKTEHFHSLYNEAVFENRGIIFKRTPFCIGCFFPFDTKSPSDKSDEIIRNETIKIIESFDNIIKNNPDHRLAVHAGKVFGKMIYMDKRAVFSAWGEDMDLCLSLSKAGFLLKMQKLATPSVVKILQKNYIFRKTGRVNYSLTKIKPLDLYDLKAKRDNEANPQLRDIINEYEKALELYLKGNFSEAVQILTVHIQKYSNDLSAVYLLEQSKKHEQNQPALWNGALDLVMF